MAVTRQHYPDPYAKQDAKGMEQQEKLNKHLAAGAQLAVARTALNQLASTLCLMEGEENENVTQWVNALCARLEDVQAYQLRQLKIDFPEASENAERAIYASPPYWAGQIFPTNRPEGETLYSWISEDYQRGVMATYVLCTVVPGKEGHYEPVAIALTRESAERFLRDGAYTVKYPIQQSRDMMVNFVDALKDMQRQREE